MVGRGILALEYIEYILFENVVPRKKAASLCIETYTKLLITRSEELEQLHILALYLLSAEQKLQKTTLYFLLLSF